MKKKPFFALAAILAGLVLSAPAGACESRAQLLALVGKIMESRPTARGVTAQGAMIEVATNERGAWAMLMTTPQGCSVLVAVGQNWRTIAPPAPGEES